MRWVLSASGAGARVAKHRLADRDAPATYSPAQRSSRQAWVQHFATLMHHLAVTASEIALGLLLGDGAGRRLRAC